MFDRQDKSASALTGFCLSRVRQTHSSIAQRRLWRQNRRSKKAFLYCFNRTWRWPRSHRSTLNKIAVITAKSTPVKTKSQRACYVPATLHVVPWLVTSQCTPGFEEKQVELTFERLFIFKFASFALAPLLLRKQQYQRKKKTRAKTRPIRHPITAGRSHEPPAALTLSWGITPEQLAAEDFVLGTAVVSLWPFSGPWTSWVPPAPFPDQKNKTICSKWLRCT